jgi:hypothetical protein
MAGERRDHAIQGSNAKERVVAALEETLMCSDSQLHKTWKHHKLPHLRAAVFLHAIERVAERYAHHGIFP